MFMRNKASSAHNRAIEELDKNSFMKSHGLVGNKAVHGVYAYSNENLMDYIDNMNISGHRVATVGSSGDQALYAIFKDAEEVTLIDANPYTKPIVELKKSAIENMTHSEFMKYWTKDSEHILDERICRDLYPSISESSREFLDYIFASHNKTFCKKKVIKSDSFAVETKLFGEKPKTLSLASGCEFYLKKSAYDIRRSKLKASKMDFVLAEYSEFPDRLDGKYGSIFVSNIFNYYNNQRHKFFEVSKKLIDRNLSKGGTMQMHYDFMGTAEDFEESYRDFLPSNKPCQRYRTNNPMLNPIVLMENEKEHIFGQEKFENVSDRDLVRSIVNTDDDFIYIYEK